MEQENRFDAFFESFESIFQMDEELLASSSVQDMIGGSVDPVELGRSQIKEYKSRGMSYDEVAEACKDIQDFLQQSLEAFQTQAQDSEPRKAVLNLVFKGIANSVVYVLENYSRADAEIGIELTHPKAKIPTQANKGDAGWDVYAVENTTISPGETAKIDLGFKVSIPLGWQLSVRPRSGVSLNTKKRISNSPGTIDSLYRGTVGIVVDNIGNKAAIILPGDKIAQLVLEKVYTPLFFPVDDIISYDHEDRGGGFGSTDIKEEINHE